MLDQHLLTLYPTQGHIYSYLRSIIPIYIEVNLIMITSSLLKTADVTASLAILYNVYIDEQVHITATYGHYTAMMMLPVVHR